MTKEHRKGSIIRQVVILFALSVLAIGLFTYFSQYMISDTDVKKQMENLSAKVSDEVALAVREYPAYKWLLRYWYEHPDDLDIEYDVEYGEGTRTEEKCRLLSERYPGIQLKYVGDREIGEMTEEDQKLYAEIVYSWLITRVNQIKRSYNIDYLFCVLTDEPYKTQFFLFSAAEPGSVRGTNYEEVYPLGVTTEVEKSQQEAMHNAQQNYRHLADAGNYVDYYALMDTIDGHAILIGMTNSLSDMRANIRSQTLNGTGSAMFQQICLSLVCLALMSLYVLRPLKHIQENIRLYKQTKDSEPVIRNLAEIRPNNEIGQLSEDISGLAEEIDNYLISIEAITAEKERVSTELNMANKIQESMLPSTFPAFPDRYEFDIYASMDPAKEVGGDFYDFFLIDSDHLCMVIADVSGKGIPAALFMMASKIILGNNAIMGKSPAEILMSTNAAICSNNREEMFVTVWLGILEISTGKLTAANAGHEYPVLKKADGRFELLKDKHGFVIGGMEGMQYQQYELQLEPGSKLFLYTDGLPEAMDAENHMFGIDRMLAVLNESVDVTPEQVLKNMGSAVDSFVKEAEQFDDLTMLCLDYKGEKAV